MKIPSIWLRYSPKFEYEETFNDNIEAWAGHSAFGYDLVKNFQPETIVELGSYKGTSLYSFLQATKDTDLRTKVFAVDSWEGDEQTGFYGEEYFNNLKAIVDKYYGSQDVQLMKMYFDEALDKFDDDSIDLLHIDGLHTYEAVKHDYVSWSPKVKKDGVILFHDTYEETFGVKKLFAEIQKEHSEYTYLNFRHSHGLGVVIKDPRAKGIFGEDNLETMLDYYEAKGTAMVFRKKSQQMEAELFQVTKDKLSLIDEVERLTAMANSYRETAEELQR